MRAWIKRLHMYAGLLNFCALTVFGIAGLTATFQGPPEARRRQPDVRFQELTLPQNLTDKQAADRVYAALHMPLASPLPEWAIHRDRESRLALDFYTVNGPTRVTVLEDQNRLRIERVRNSLWQFLNNMHAVTMADGQRPLRIRLWSAYNEFAIWSLIGMSLSGLYLWLSSRPQYRWAQYSLAGGSGLFLVLYALSR